NEVMPDLGYEIEDFQYYTWRITGWSGSEKMIKSPEFEAGCWKWHILLYPFGDNNSDTVSIYLGFAGWHSHVQFALLLWNPEDPTSYVSHQTQYRFTAEKSAFGFPQFYDLRKLFAPSENRTRSLIENDACNITAFVRIINDPLVFIWHDFTNKEIKVNERHLYLPTKIVTPNTFSRHQGFDLANFHDRQYSLSDVPQFMVLKSETYGNFKSIAAKLLGYPAEQIRFWVLVNRQNKTARPYTPIIDNFLDMTMEEIYTRLTPRQYDLKLFLEVEKPINDKVWFPQVENGSPHILVFIKYFDPDTQSLEGLGHLYIQNFAKVSDIIPILCEKKNFPPHTPLKIYEEIKPNMIEKMKPKLTFQKAEIQNGDIICFQKALTSKE
ncbi:27881_t:CDS:2, partial [Gigaspora margarita]